MESPYRWPRHAELNEEHHYFGEKNYFDIIIKFGDNQIHAHKVVLARMSKWFERAFLGGFSSATNPIIDLGDEDDPNLVTGMIRYMYNLPHISHRSRHWSGMMIGEDRFAFLIDLYMMGDKYDCSRLREEAKDRYLSLAERDLSSPSFDTDYESKFILSIPAVCGPSAPQFADTALQNALFLLCIENREVLFQNKLFLGMYTNQNLFNSSFITNFGLVMTKLALHSKGVCTSTIDSRIIDLSESSSVRLSGFDCYNNPAFSDVIIKTGIVKFFAHKVILATRSSRFRLLLTENCSELNLGDDHPDDVEAMLCRIYDHSYIAYSFSTNLYQMSIKYGITKLRVDIANRLLNHLDGLRESEYYAYNVARICGPSSAVSSLLPASCPVSEFAGYPIQDMVVDLRVRNYEILFARNPMFVKMLVEGTLFDEEWTRRFAVKMGKARVSEVV